MNQDNEIQGTAGTPRGFDEMDLAEPILKAVRKAGYETPSPIQECAIPCLLYTSPSPRDVEESRMPSSA